jgi:hypothetical protein
VNLSKVTEVLATVAPSLATALGGPLAGAATQAIATAILGDAAATPQLVENANNGAAGSDLVKLKEVELTFKAQMEEAGVELENIAAKDRASARDRQARMKDWTPSVLGLAIIVGFFGVLTYLFRFGLPQSGSEVLLIMVGALGAMTTQVGNYFFGSSTGSKSKDVLIANIREQSSS